MSTQGLLRSALERLNDLLKCKPETVKGVLDGAVEQLNSDLGGVADILSDVDADAEINRQVRKLAYDIEDSVECFVLRQEAELKSSSSSKWSTYLRCLYKYCTSEESFLEDVYVFSRRARELTVNVNVIGSSSTDTGAQQIIDRPSTPDTNYVEPAPIGFDDYKKKVMMGVLAGQESELRLSVLPICGMGGIGKTYLARLVFNDSQVMDYFDCRAWVYVGSVYKARDILESSLSSLQPNTSKKKFAAMETTELAEMLYKFLFGRRYFICLDDVWGTEIWDSLRFVFPDNHNGSRILITTRSMEVAHYTSGSTPPIKMQSLTEEESWQLLQTKAGLHHDPGTNNPEREMILKQILKRCGGLPLAIIAIGQILSTTSLQDWKLLQPILLSDEEENVSHVLDLSYKHSSFRLKPCLLYMGHFLPDQPISVDKLHLLWMAEGLISTRKEADEDYFKELDNRSLVNVVEREDLLTSRSFRYCQVHDLVHDFCVSRGKLEEFFEVVDFSHANELSTSTCRLAVYLDKFKETNDVTLNIPDAKRIRSILFFETEPKSTWPSEVADLTNFQYIRVLDFDGVDFQGKKLPGGIEKLIYLRHLSFRGCYLQEFPSSYGNFFFLVTLDLRVMDTCILTIPNVLRKLSRLRHLYFPLAFRCNGKDKLKLDCLKSLEVIENFDTGSCDAEDLLHLENLQILTAIVDANNLDLKRVIEKEESISELSLVVKRFDCYSKERLSIVAELLQCNVLHALDLEGHLGAFPNGITFGLNITGMVFNGSEFSEDPMPILGKLPKLRSLVLCNDAFLGPKLVCDESDFPQLKSLKLATLQYLEEWEVKSGAMLSLTTLAIEQCHKLKMLPSQLPNIPTLKNVMIGSMPEEFQQTIQEAIGRSNDISVTFYDC